MTTKISKWNGYDVYGDIRELDNIVSTDGLINLDKEDIISVLSAEGENYLTASVNVDLGEAFNQSLIGLSSKLDNVNRLLIDFRCGNKQLKMSELSSITATLSEANTNINVIWGMSSDETLIDSYKVILLASVKV